MELCVDTQTGERYEIEGELVRFFIINRPGKIYPDRCSRARAVSCA